MAHQARRTTDRKRAAAVPVRWLSIPEVAKLTSYSTETIKREIELKRLKASKPTGRGWRIEVSELERWMAAGATD